MKPGVRQIPRDIASGTRYTMRYLKKNIPCIPAQTELFIFQEPISSQPCKQWQHSRKNLSYYNGRRGGKSNYSMKMNYVIKNLNPKKTQHSRLFSSTPEKDQSSNLLINFMMKIFLMNFYDFFLKMGFIIIFSQKIRSIFYQKYSVFIILS